MKETIKEELVEYILDMINDNVLNNDNKDEWHFHCFNEDYYIIYHYNAVQWLKKHDLDVFEAISIVKEYEVDNFGEMTTDINPESIVNMLAYIYSEELINSFDANNVKELKEELINLI